MGLNFTDDEFSFRNEVRGFFLQRATAGYPQKSRDRPAHLERRAEALDANLIREGLGNACLVSRLGRDRVECSQAVYL